MKPVRLSRLEFEIMEVLWTRGQCAVREIQDALPGKKRPAYTTIQTTVYRLETKGAVHIAKRIGNANVFEAAISRDAAQGRLIDELLTLFGGKSKPVMAHLVETGKLTLEDIREAEQALKELARKGRK
jgi:BlaI family transcriptional regulator, penicillinase repressor